MSRRLLVSALPGEVRAAWIEGGRLTDLIVQRDDKPTVADNVYLGRVRALDRGLGAAFVDVGLARPGFLPLREAPAGVSEGDALMVRVKREPSAEKGARLALPADARSADLVARSKQARPPALLHAPADPVAAALDAEAPPAEVVVDDTAVFVRLRSGLARREGPRPRLDLDPAPLFEREGIEAEIDALLEPRVALPSGGSLLIEPVRTLTAIDVNAGRDRHGGDQGLALSVNLEAAAEIPRQLRLRNLSGLLVVDFLTLADPAARKRVTRAMERGLADDPRPRRLYAMRPSGLVEMTRRRLGPPLHELLCQPSGIGGGGWVKDPVTLAYAALRAARAAGTGVAGGGVRLDLAPGVAVALNGPAARARAAVEERLGRPIRLLPEPDRAGFEVAPA